MPNGIEPAVLGGTAAKVAAAPPLPADVPTYPTLPTAKDAVQAWRNDLPERLRARSTTRGVLLFAACLGLYCLAFVGAFLGPWLPLRMFCGAMLPLAIGAMFLTGHDAGHHSLTPVGWLNALLGRLSCLPAYHPYTSWTYAHNSLHHAWTCLKGKHPDFPPRSKEEYDAMPGWRKLVERVYRGPLGPGVANIFDFWIPYVACPPAGRIPERERTQLRIDQALVAAFVVGQLLLARWLAGMTPNAALPPWPLALVVVLGSWLVWICSMGLASYLQHTHPRIAWYDNEAEWTFHHAQLRGSAHVNLPLPFDRLLSNIMDHPAHHLDPRLSLHALPESQRRLEEHAEHHSMVVSASPFEYFRTVRACKLYDYRRHCWTDFQGNATSELGLNKA